MSDADSQVPDQPATTAVTTVASNPQVSNVATIAVTSVTGVHRINGDDKVSSSWLLRENYIFLFGSHLRTCVEFCLPPELIAIIMTFLMVASTRPIFSLSDFIPGESRRARLVYKNVGVVFGWRIDEISTDFSLPESSNDLVCLCTGTFHLSASMTWIFDPSGIYPKASREILRLSIRINGVSQSSNQVRQHFDLYDTITLSTAATIHLSIGDVLDVFITQGVDRPFRFCDGPEFRNRFSGYLVH